MVDQLTNPSEAGALLDAAQAGSRQVAPVPVNPEHALRFRTFQSRHIGPDAEETAAMLKAVSAPSLDALMDGRFRPASASRRMNLPAGQPEHQFSKAGHRRPQPDRASFIGYGYADCITPSVILQCAGESGLVLLHAVSADRAPPRIASISRRW